MSKLKLIAPAVVLAAGFAVLTTASYAKPEYSKSEKKACAFCHVDAKATPKALKEAGTYFKEHNHSFEGYKK